MNLRPYQQKLKADILAAWAAGERNVLAVMPTGAGKTVTMADIIHHHGEPTVAIAHRQELVTQISTALAREGVRHRIIGPKSVIKLAVRLHMEELGRSFYDPMAKCAVAGVDTLVRREEPWFKTVTLWVQDECFPAGTLIDGKPIESIRLGETVLSYNEVSRTFEHRKVTRLFKNPAPNYMVSLQIAHHVLYCTPNHPILTKKGWKDAESVTKEDYVYLVQGERGGFERAPKSAVRKNWSSLLLKRLFECFQSKAFFRNNGRNQQKVCFRENEEKQPDATRSIPKENERNIKVNKAPAKASWREWSTTNKGRSEAMGVIFRYWVSITGYCSYWALPGGRRIPKPLQDRLRASHVKSWDRSGRLKSLFYRTTEARPKEGQLPCWKRVDNVTLQKRTDITDPVGRCGDGYVYNFEVEGTHTYVANGIVVHNCHHVCADNKWGTAAQLFPNARGLGVTATPVRADGKGLGRHHDGLMDIMVEGPSMRDLINMGYLTDYRIFAPPSDLDLSDVAVSATTGDYSQPGVVKAVRKSHIVGDVVSHYQRIAPGKLGVTFATDVQTATEIAEQFNAAGVPAEVVSAKTPDAERVAVLRRFRKREVLQLVNVDLFGEGFDLPAIEVVSMARPTQSFSLFAQQFGRALRILEGKTEALIIDHVGNVLRHGLPDAPRKWSLDRRDKKGRSGPSDVMPVKACPACTGVYERFYPTCPFCGHKPEPAGRSKPEFVDGDLTELDGATLAAMRGAVDEVDKPLDQVRAELMAKHAPEIGIRAGVKRHRERQDAQAELRHAIAVWAGAGKAAGRSDSELYRLFYLTFGVDVLSAKALGTKDAEALRLQIEEMMR